MTWIAKIAAVPLVLLALGSGNATAQSLGQTIGQALNKESQLLRNQADNDRLKAEVERSRAEADAAAVEAGQQMSRASSPTGGSTHPSSARYMVAGTTDDFGILKVPTYVLPNGVRIQASGRFWAGEGVTCISLCPTASVR